LTWKPTSDNIEALFPFAAVTCLCMEQGHEKGMMRERREGMRLKGCPLIMNTGRQARPFAGCALSQRGGEKQPVGWYIL